VGSQYKICITKQVRVIMLKSENNVITLSFNTIFTAPVRYIGRKKYIVDKFVVTARSIMEIFE